MKLKVLILLFVPFMLAACRDDDNPRSRPNFVETSFTDISGELTNDYGEEVLTDRNTLYGISVRLDNLHTYSYGLFDDLSKAATIVSPILTFKSRPLCILLQRGPKGEVIFVLGVGIWNPVRSIV